MGTKVENLSQLKPNSQSHSYSNPLVATITHMSMKLELNMSDKTVLASNVLSIRASSSFAERVILDVDGLDIISIRYCDNLFEHVAFTLTEHDPLYGQGLIITLPSTSNCRKCKKQTEKPREEEVERFCEKLLVDDGNQQENCQCDEDREVYYKLIIKYKVNPDVSGLVWDMNENGLMVRSNFGYTKARSVVPCQDEPSVKFTFQCNIIAPKQYQVLMSAILQQKILQGGAQVSYKFDQSLPVASHQIGFVIGTFLYYDVSSMTRVWYSPKFDDMAERSEVLNNLSHIPQIIKIMEHFQGNFVWGLVDIVLMEEPVESPLSICYPCLNWLSVRSTLVEMANLIVRNWLGTVVSCQTFHRDVWLMEAYAKYMERMVLSMINTDYFSEDVWKEGLKTLKNMCKGEDETLPRETSSLATFGQMSDNGQDSPNFDSYWNGYYDKDKGGTSKTSRKEVIKDFENILSNIRDTHQILDADSENVKLDENNEREEEETDEDGRDRRVSEIISYFEHLSKENQMNEENGWNEYNLHMEHSGESSRRSGEDSPGDKEDSSNKDASGADFRPPDRFGDREIECSEVTLVMKLMNFVPDIALPKVRRIVSEKGAILFYILSEICGHFEFLSFLKHLLFNLKYETLTTQRFIEEIEQYFPNEQILLFDWDKFLYKTDLIAPKYGIDHAHIIQLLAQVISLNEKQFPFSRIDMKMLSTKQMKYLLMLLGERRLTRKTIEHMEQVVNVDEREDLQLKEMWRKLCLNQRGEVF